MRERIARTAWAITAISLVAPVAHGDPPTAAAVDALRIATPDEGIVVVDVGAIGRLAPTWPRGGSLRVTRRGKDVPVSADGERLRFLARRTRVEPRTPCVYEIRPGPAAPPSPPPWVTAGAENVVHRLEVRDDDFFGRVASDDPRVYDRAVPHWFLTGLSRAGSVDVSLPDPPPKPVAEARVVVRVEVVGTDWAPVTLGARWGETDLGEATAASAAGGAVLTFPCFGRDVPSGSSRLVLSDRRPKPATPEEGHEAGTVWIDAVVIDVPAPATAAPRIEVEPGIWVALREIDGTPLLRAHRDPPDPVEAARGADMVVLATAPLLPDAKRLADHRSRTGVRAVVVPAGDVWDRIAGGEASPEAIREYLAAVARAGGPPRFVLLCGDATYDRTDMADVETIPTALARTEGNGATASDRLLVRSPSDATAGGPIVGRLPFRDPTELAAYVDRVVRYETSPPADATRRTLRFVTSSPGGSGSQFFDRAVEGLFASTITNRIPAAFDVTVTAGIVGHRYSWPPPEFSAKVVSELNAGALVFTYAGHGWAHGFDTLEVDGQIHEILTCRDAPDVAVTGTPPVAFVLACSTASFASPSEDSIAENLLARPAGPLSYWGAAGDCDQLWNALVGVELSSELFADRERRLGESIEAAVGNVVARKGRLDPMARILGPLTGTPDLDRVVAEGSRMYALLGDPALRIAWPKEDLVVRREPVPDGLRIEVTGPIPDGTTVQLSVEVPRDVDLGASPASGRTDDSEAIRENHRRANDKSVWHGTGVAAGGSVSVVAPLRPEHRARQLWVKTWAVFGGDVHQGAVDR